MEVRVGGGEAMIGGCLVGVLESGCGKGGKCCCEIILHLISPSSCDGNTPVMASLAPGYEQTNMGQVQDVISTHGK